VIAAVVWMAGTAGMVVSSIRGNNNGWVVTCGMATALASVVLLSVSAAIRHEPIDVFDEALAEQLDGDVNTLVEAGADEDAVRSLVRDAMRLGRRT
jgi:hypothetical protein